MTYVKVKGAQYPAAISGRMSDQEWDDRPSKSIKLEMTYEEALKTWVEGISWSIISMNITSEMMLDEDGNPIIGEDGYFIHQNVEHIEEFDNSDYNLAGDITDHRNGFVTVKMGKLTELEQALELLLA